MLRQATQQCLGVGAAAVAAEHQQFCSTRFDLLLQAAQDAADLDLMGEFGRVGRQTLGFVDCVLFGVFVQYPGASGRVWDPSAVFDAAHVAGALANLSYESEENCEAVRAAGGVAPLAALLAAGVSAGEGGASRDGPSR
jgi:hypothetical protein